MTSKFVNIIRQKVMKEDSISVKTEKEREKEKLEEPPKYIGILDSDISQRIQHTIRNLLPLDEEELLFIEDMNCRNMFEIVKLLDSVIVTLLENLIGINNN